MKATLTAPSDAKACPASEASPSVSPSRPALQDIVAAICADARHDSVKFVLRSNVGHDGE